MSVNSIKRCTKCVLPETFPGISFDVNGVCSYCDDFFDRESQSDKEKIKKQMEEEINKSRGRGDYDCIVAYSGGKDSTFTLMYLVKNYKLKCLAVTIDNDFVSNTARENCFQVTKNLGVDFILYKPSPTFMKGMYKTSILKGGIQSNSAIKRASSICNSCISIVNNYVLKVALMHGTSLIAGGYIGGQIPSDSSVIKLNLSQREKIKRSVQDKYDDLYGKDAGKYFFIDEHLMRNITSDQVITIINPLLTIAIGEEEIIAAIQELGWKRAVDTGLNSSNCRLNDLGIFVHYKKHGFHPYELEVSNQVRQGLMKRDDGLKKVINIPDLASLNEQINKIGINPNEF